MLSKKLLAKTASDSTDNFEMTEKMKNLEDEDFLLKARAGRRRHSVQLDKRITQGLLLEAKSDRRSSNASSYGGESESLCKFDGWLVDYKGMAKLQREVTLSVWLVSLLF